jgi:hypothetical protein
MRKNLKKYLTPNFPEQHPDSFTNQGAALAQSTPTSKERSGGGVWWVAGDSNRTEER